MRDYRNKNELTRDEQEELAPAQRPDHSHWFAPFRLKKQDAAAHHSSGKLGTTSVEKRDSGVAAGFNKRHATSSDRTSERVSDRALVPTPSASGKLEAPTVSAFAADPQPVSRQRLWETLQESARTVFERTSKIEKDAQAIDTAFIRRRQGDEALSAIIVRLLVAIAFITLWDLTNDQYDDVTKSFIVEQEAALLLKYAPQGITLIDQLPPKELAEAREKAIELSDPVFGMTAKDSLVVANVFLTVGIAAAVVALAQFLLILSLGRLSDSGITRASDKLGDAVAAMLCEIDDALAEVTQRLQGPANDAGARDISIAHLYAEEAVLLFEEVEFMADANDTDTDTRSAVDRYRDYLQENRVVSGERNVEFTVFGGLVGFAIGSYLMFEIWLFILVQMFSNSGSGAPATRGDILNMLSKLAPDFVIASYPAFSMMFWAGLTTILLGGFIGELASIGIFSSARRRRLKQSLASVRGAIIRAEAPGPRDIAIHVDTLSSIFAERLSRKTNGAPGGQPNDTNGNDGVSAYGHGRSSFLPEAGSPEEASNANQGGIVGGVGKGERQGDETPRFVAPQFESAPKTWMAGSDGRLRDTFFHREQDSGSASKRWFSSLAGRPKK